MSFHYLQFHLFIYMHVLSEIKVLVYYFNFCCVCMFEYMHMFIFALRS